MAGTNRRHDVIAADLHDPLETTMGDVGLLVLEDPETGEMVWIDTEQDLASRIPTAYGCPAREYNPGLLPSRRRSDQCGHELGLRSAPDRASSKSAIIE